MNKVIVHVKATGATCVTRLVPWARLAQAVTLDGKRMQATSPMRLEQFDLQPAVRSIDRYEEIEPHVEWAETEDEFIQRAVGEETDEIDPVTLRKTGRLVGKIMPAGTDYRVVDVSDVPLDKSLYKTLLGS